MENLNIDSDVVIGQLADAIAKEGSSSKILAASFKKCRTSQQGFC